MNNNNLLKSLQSELGSLVQDVPFSHTNNKALPYMETLSRKSIEEEVHRQIPHDTKREVDHFLQRSPLYAKTSFLQKFKKLPKEKLQSTYKDLVFLHREYSDMYKNNLKQIIHDSKGKTFNTLECLEAVRSLSDPINLSRMQSYFQTLAPSALVKFWKNIFESLNSK